LIAGYFLALIRETMISNVLFDLDGTLTDPKDGITRCIQFSLGRLGIATPPRDELTWCIGPPLRESFSRLLSTSDNSLLDTALLYYRERFSEIGIYENSIYPEISSVLQRIHRIGFRIFLATSKPTVFASRILDHFALTQFFHGIYGSGLDGHLSDKGELVAYILRVEGLDPQQTLIAGDRSNDVLGGKKNGIMTAAVTYGYGTPDEIKMAAPDFIFDTPLELAAFLEMKKPPNDRMQPIAHTGSSG
jgi:phosphoglycolate phosphatase